MVLELRTKLDYGSRPLLRICVYPIEKRHAFLYVCALMDGNSIYNVA